MNINPSALKIASPYVNAFIDSCYGRGKMLNIGIDFRNVEVLLETSKDLKRYLKNPLIIPSHKQEILDKILKKRVSKETLRFLFVLIQRNRINLIEAIVKEFLRLMCKRAIIRSFMIETAFSLSSSQRNRLAKKIQNLLGSIPAFLEFEENPSLIGGVLITTGSKKIDFTIKNKLQKLSKHLNSVLEI